MTYPIPPDPRATDDFDVVRGWDTMDRRDFVFSDTIAGDLECALGEPVRFVGGTDGVVKVDGTPAADYVVGVNANERPAGISWTTYNSDFDNGGFPDALSTGMVTVLQGKFSCKFNNASDAYFVPKADAIFPTMIDPIVGADVVAVYDHSITTAKYGCVPTAAAARYQGGPTADQVAIDACVIGKVSEVSGDYVTVDFNI
jgi:hypothetical protein